jgi:cell division septal protein FtsQ
VTRVRKIGPAAVQPPRTRKRRSGAGRILRGTDGHPVRARRLTDPVTLRVRLLRLGAVLLAFGFFAVLWTRPVREIEVQGVWLSSTEFITAMMEPELGRRWITTPTKNFERELARDPWIDEVRVSRAPGARILVEVREAQPVFCADVGGQMRVVDRHGAVLPECDGLLIGALPVLAGIRFDGNELEAEDRRRVVSLLGALDSSSWVWSEGLARVDLRDSDEVLLQSRDGVEVVVRLDDAHDQLAAASAVWDRLDTNSPTRVDLRFEDQIVLSH